MKCLLRTQQQPVGAEVIANVLGIFQPQMHCSSTSIDWEAGANNLTWRGFDKSWTPPLTDFRLKNPTLEPDLKFEHFKRTFLQRLDEFKESRLAAAERDYHEPAAPDDKLFSDEVREYMVKRFDLQPNSEERSFFSSIHVNPLQKKFQKWSYWFTPEESYSTSDMHLADCLKSLMIIAAFAQSEDPEVAADALNAILVLSKNPDRTPIRTLNNLSWGHSFGVDKVVSTTLPIYCILNLLIRQARASYRDSQQTRESVNPPQTRESVNPPQTRESVYPPHTRGNVNYPQARESVNYPQALGYVQPGQRREIVSAAEERGWVYFGPRRGNAGWRGNGGFAGWREAPANYGNAGWREGPDNFGQELRGDFSSFRSMRSWVRAKEARLNDSRPNRYAGYFHRHQPKRSNILPNISPYNSDRLTEVLLSDALQDYDGPCQNIPHYLFWKKYCINRDTHDVLKKQPTHLRKMRDLNYPDLKDYLKRSFALLVVARIYHELNFREFPETSKSEWDNALNFSMFRS